MTPDEALLRSLEAERASGMPRWHIHPKPAPVAPQPASMHDIDELVHAVTGHRVTIAQLTLSTGPVDRGLGAVDRSCHLGSVGTELIKRTA